MKTNFLTTATLLAIVTGWFSAGATLAQDATTNSLVIHADQGKVIISKNIYGQFSEHLGHCIYGGIWVGEGKPTAHKPPQHGAEQLLQHETDKSLKPIPNTRGIRNDVVAALKEIKVPVLRWPGGCFADKYHWMDGIGPREKRPPIINTTWGGVVENNAFGTHEFLDFCEQIGCEPYICVNVGSGTVQEMMEWMEYMTSDADSPMANLRRKNGREKPWKVPFVAVGNESWGCGGNMTAEYYADNFFRYNTFIQDYAGNKVYRVGSGGLEADYHWTDVLLKRSNEQKNHGGRQMDGYSLHYYTLSNGRWPPKGLATEFTEAQWHATLRHALRMDELINKHSAIMDKYDPQKRVGLIVDEWGTWHDVEPGTNPGFLYQQNTLRDALVAGVTLNLFNQHADRVKMANIAQMVNVLQAMILTDKEKMILTPTYHVFDMFKAHQEAIFLPSELTCEDYVSEEQKIPGLSVSASKDKSGAVHVTLCNLNPTRPARINCELQGAKAGEISGQVLTAAEMNAHNTFEQPENVHPVKFNAFTPTENGFVTTLPAKSVVVLELK